MQKKSRREIVMFNFAEYFVSTQLGIVEIFGANYELQRKSNQFYNFWLSGFLEFQTGQYFFM